MAVLIPNRLTDDAPSQEPSQNSLRTVLIYRDQLLPYSETFIPAQATSLSGYAPLYVGSARLPVPPGMVSPLGPGAETAIVLEELAAPARAWKMAYKFMGIVHPRWQQALALNTPSLLHAHFGGDGGLAIPLARRLNIPLLVTFHGYDATWQTPDSGLNVVDLLHNRGQFFRQMLLQKRDATFKAANCIIAVSRFIEAQLIARGAPADNIQVHYIGIDLAKFRPNLAQNREPIVLFVGRLVEKKGCEYLLKAMAAVQKTVPSAKVVIIGDGPLRHSLETLAQQTLSHYQFLGVQSPLQVREWMNRAYVLCGPSIIANSGDAEGLGMVFAEAQAMHLPVVAFDSGGIGEVVVHEQTGLLTPEKNIDGLVTHLLTLFAHPELRESMAQAGRAHVERVFNLPHNSQQLERLYDQVIERFRRDSLR
jgi:colanic acid/amylovoran biosynthesis glycosyltransferase